MKIFRICMVVIIAVMGMLQEARYVMAEEIPYRLLHSDWRQFSDGEKRANYAISVERFLDRPQIEQLICQLLRDKKPSSVAGFSGLSVLIFHSLDRFNPSSFPSMDKMRLERMIAIYVWNMELPRPPNQLQIWTDDEGKRLDPIRPYEFDYTKVCPQSMGNIVK